MQSFTRYDRIDLKLKIEGILIRMKNNTTEPLYMQLADKMKEKITRGTWVKGSKIPSERDLIVLYDVSRITVRAAIAELSNVGILEKVHGKGTFVVSKTIVQDLGGMYSFSDEMKKKGKASSTKVLEKRVIVANDFLSNKLNIAENTKLIELIRLRIDSDNKPLLMEKSYFPFDRYEFLMEEELNEFSLYDMLEKKYSITFDYAVEKFKASKLDQSEMQILNPDGKNEDYGMLIRRTSYKDNVIEYYSSQITLGDVFEFSIKLQNH